MKNLLANLNDQSVPAQPAVLLPEVSRIHSAAIELDSEGRPVKAACGIRRYGAVEKKQQPEQDQSTNLTNFVKSLNLDKRKHWTEF